MRTAVTALSSLALLTLVSSAAAAPTARRTLQIRGDVTMIGSTLAHDCGSTATPPSGATISCTGVLENDTAPDIYWRDNTAGPLILPRDARTSARLDLPAGATVVYARLYWGAMVSGTIADTTVVLDRSGTGAFTVPVVADSSKTLPAAGPAPLIDHVVYQSSADVTTIVATNGSGEYRVTDVDAVVLRDVTTETAFSAWSLVVIYSLPGAPNRHVALYDGLDLVRVEDSITVPVTGFTVPATGKSGTLWAWAFDGDDKLSGDSISFAGSTLASGTDNPSTNFYNGTRTALGARVPGLVPALSGAPGSMSGFDLDAVDVTSALVTGATSASFGTATTDDSFWLGGFATSIVSAAPNFVTTKTFVDLNGGKVIPGDVLEFTIATTNTGDDEATSVVLTDTLPTGLTYVPNSLSVATGANAGTKTDLAADDQGEVVGNVITVRLGTGASATAGGSVLPGESTSVKFRVTVTAAPGNVVNQANVTASGKAGAPSTVFASDSDPATPGAQGTTIAVVQCDASGGCVAPLVCDLVTNTCGPALDAGVDTGVDTGTDSGADTFVEDTFVPDTFVPDTFVEDTTVPDTRVPDTTVPDTFVEDTTVPDTTVPDTAVPDATVADAIVEDTAMLDDAIEAGDGGVDASDATDATDATDAIDTGVADTALPDVGGDGSLDDVVIEGSGCACTIPARTNGEPGLLVLAIVGGCIVLVRRRR